VLLAGIGLVAAAPASAHSYLDSSMCGSGYDYYAGFYLGGTIARGSVFVKGDPFSTADYCVVGFALGAAHGVPHYQRVRVHKNGNAYLAGDIDAGTYSHYAGPVNKQANLGHGDGDCLQGDYTWTDPATGITRTATFQAGDPTAC
jgi:hypothetical protein